MASHLCKFSFKNLGSFFKRALGYVFSTSSLLLIIKLLLNFLHVYFTLHLFEENIFILSKIFFKESICGVQIDLGSMVESLVILKEIDFFDIIDNRFYRWLKKIPHYNLSIYIILSLLVMVIFPFSWELLSHHCIILIKDFCVSFVSKDAEHDFIKTKNFFTNLKNTL